jgi:hypothetical protein
MPAFISLGNLSISSIIKFIFANIFIFLFIFIFQLFNTSGNVNNPCTVEEEKMLLYLTSNIKYGIDREK